MVEQAGSQPRVDRRFARTEKAIRAALHRLVESGGLESVSVSALAREADINRKTFYLHYDSVDHLVDRVSEEQAYLIADNLQKVISGSDDRSAVLRELSDGISANMKMLRGVTDRMSIQSQIQKLEKPLSEALLADDAYGFGNDSAFAHYLVIFLVAGLLAMYRRWLLTGSEVPFDELARVEEFVVESLHSAAAAGKVPPSRG